MTLPDAAARERVTRETAQTLFVEAAAGAGKTTALVGRIVELVAGGMPVERIAAITFTEKAAAELTDRVRERLERAAAGDGEYARLGPEERERCRAAIGGLDGASFQTIHAFARKLLAAHPVQAGLPPEFDVLDGTEEELELREAVRRFLDEVERSDATRTAVMTAYALGLQPGRLRELAREFARNWDRLRGGEFDLPAAEPDWEPPLGRLLDAVNQNGQSDSFQPAFDGLLEVAGRLERAYRQVQAAESAAEREAGLAEVLTLAGRVKIPLNAGRQGTFRPVKDGWDAWLTEVRRWALARLLPAVQAFALDYAAERRRRGRLTFHDLLVLTTDLLREDETARRAVHGRFGQLLIDEFQDTDPPQVELAALIAADPGQPADWQTADVAPGRLFFVGDPKQSIYRFRRADIRIYEQAKRAFGSQEVQLVTNFRSAKSVIAWVNGVCRRLFEADAAGAQAGWADLEARPGAPDGKPVRVFGGLVEDAAAAEVQEREAADVALGVLQARAENWGGREGGTRFEDIAILLPRRTVLGALERALADRGIPYRVESQSLLYAAEEIRDLLNVLTAIDDPTDEIALVAALRSPLFACTDRELAEHAAAGGRWSYERPAPDGSPERVRRAMAQLAAWHRERWTVSPAGLIERLIAESHLLLKALGDTRPRETWRRYRIIAEQARALTVRGAVATLRQFTAWLEQQQDEGVRVNEAIAPEPDDDAVRVMTIHAAKGLEFPVVFVAGLGTGTNRSPSIRTWWPPHGDGGLPEVRCGSGDQRFETAGFAAVEDEEKAHEEAEAARLFYVAATRAQQALAVSLYRTKRSDGGSLAGRVEAALEAAPAGTFERFTPKPAEVPGVRARPGEPPPVPAADAWRERRESAAKCAAAPVAAATAIAHAAAPGAPEEPEEPPATPAEPWRKGRAGTAIGRAVHAVLQGIDLGTGEGLEAAAAAQAEAEGIADRADEVKRLAGNALASAAVQAAVASGRYWREVYVGADVGGVLVEGFIDLLYEGQDGLVIVDYKTDGLRSAAEADRVMPQYRLQAGAYAAALEQAAGLAAAAAVFVFTEPSIERRVDDLAAAKAEALERARELAGLAASAGG
ncbi:UvrD-helicase domain-containing protein [Tepidiforma flava]|uniref:DNA 3'-5' helicase n=1 Tax=Tepidiforma flava TaxID=3004094 RepID=A0ABY7M9B3_9CHLR|nr:UvrD-helicase domain-containing protein [Tepidiforma flava]WBL36598.1 UvrD-helicase domain-containing protein [Tepidiforma flava]